MKNILIIDPVCPKEYSPTTLAAEGMGGTEATVIRVAEALSQHAYVTVAQHNRRHSELSGNAHYSPIKTSHLSDKRDAVIVLRNPDVAIKLRRFRPSTPIYLWLHDLVSPKMLQYTSQLAEKEIKVICVSDWHRTQFIELAKTDNAIKVFPRVHRIYNPVADSIVPDTTAVDPNKLVFFSSPHKGLDYALATFKNLLNFNPDFKLFIANPGYFASSDTRDPGIHNLGVCTHADILQHVRSSLCVFYPNHVFPETFGLVMAEANMVGTPVVTHPIGAAPEVLNGQWQLCNTKDPKVLIDTVMRWHADRPKVTGKPEFKLSNVIKEWRKLLNV